MTRTVPDGYEPGSAEECRRDGEQYAAQATQTMETADQMMRELAEATQEGRLPESTESTALRAVLATTVTGALHAQLAVAARLGQVAAALGDWAAAPPVPGPPVASPVAPARLAVLDPDDSGGEMGRWMRRLRRELAAAYIDVFGEGIDGRPTADLVAGLYATLAALRRSHLTLSPGELARVRDEWIATHRGGGTG